MAQLKGGPSGDLMIAVDGAQSLYGRDRSFTWKSVGVRAVGRTQRLSRNYRNTKQTPELTREFWGRHFEVLDVHESLFGYQDVAVLRA